MFVFTAISTVAVATAWFAASTAALFLPASPRKKEDRHCHNREGGPGLPVIFHASPHKYHTHLIHDQRRDGSEESHEDKLPDCPFP